MTCPFEAVGLVCSFVDLGFGEWEVRHAARDLEAVHPTADVVRVVVRHEGTGHGHVVTLRKLEELRNVPRRVYDEALARRATADEVSKSWPWAQPESA